MPVIPILMVSAGAALARLPTAWSQRNWSRLASFVAVGVVMAGIEFACRPGSLFWREGKLFHVQDEARGREALGTFHAQRAAQHPETLAEALKHYQSAADVMPALPGLQLKIGQTMMRSDDPQTFEKAGVALDLAVRQRPYSAEARRFFAHWLYLRGRRSEAIEQYLKVVELQQWGEVYQEALLALGIALVQEGRHEETQTWLVRAMQNDPRDAMTVTTFVDVARWLREHDKAREGIALLNAGLRDARDRRALLGELRDAYLQAGESGRAAEVEAQLAATPPHAPE